MSHPYLVLLRARSTRAAYLSVLLSAVPLGTITVGLILSVQAWTGSLSSAGAVAAAFTLGNAVGLIVQGVLIDVLGDRLLLPAAGLVSASALTAIAVAGHDLEPGPLVAFAVVAGLAMPAITAAVRRLLPQLISDARTRSAGYAVLSVMFQLAFALGPLMVTLAVVVGHEPSVALLIAAFMILLACGVFYGAVSHRSAAAGVRPGRGRVRLSALRALVRLYALAVLVGTSVGITTIAVPAVLQVAGSTALVGLAFTANAVGDVVGAVALGARNWRWSERQQLAAALFAASCVGGLVFLASTSPWLLVITLGVGGAVGAPVAIRMSSLLDSLTAPETLGLAYGALVSIGLLSTAAGTSVAGQASALLAAPHLLIGPPLLLLLAAVVAVVPQRTPMQCR